MNDEPSDGAVYALIDPPAGPYRPPYKIMEWIAELEAMSRIPEVSEALREARHWLKCASQGENSGGFEKDG